MNVDHAISTYIESQPEPKRRDLEALHAMILGLMPSAKLWFLDGTDESGKVVSNPNIGYGSRLMTANGKSSEFYRVGLSANTTGISVYIMGIADKNYLPETFGDKIGKAKVTGYCIKFRKLADIDLSVLGQAVQAGLAS